MNANERIILNNLKIRTNTLKDITSTNYDTYKRWDAESKTAIVEIKSRNKYYPTTQLEKMKYDSLIEESKRTGKTAYYVVRSPEVGIAIFNLNQLTADGYDFNWRDYKCPATTDFANKKYINKKCGEIQWAKAVHTI